MVNEQSCWLLKKKKVLLSFLLPYGIFLIVANVIYRKVFLSRKGEGLTPICCFCCCCKFNFTFKINKIFSFPESRLPLPLWGRWKPYPTPEFNKCHWWGSIYDLDKGIEKLEVFPTILGHYDDFSHGGAMTDR